MANLIGSTAPTISATQISSPLTLMETGNGMIEYSGSVFLNNGSSVDIITNNRFGLGKYINTFFNLF